MVLRRIVALFSGVAGATWFAACQSGVPHPSATTAQPAAALVEVDYPPPPARVEFVPARPSGGAVWVNGEWLWQGRRWAWRPGGWVVPPEGAGYAQRALVRRNDGKLFVASGTWRDADGGEVQVPIQRMSRSRSGAVVNPQGETEPTAADVQPDAGADGRNPMDDVDAGPRERP